MNEITAFAIFRELCGTELWGPRALHGGLRRSMSGFDVEGFAASHGPLTGSGAKPIADGQPVMSVGFDAVPAPARISNRGWNDRIRPPS